MTREEAIDFIEQVGADLGFIDVELVVNKIYDEHEAQMKAKDEEIVELKLEVLNSFPKIANSKSRSIVAMLFWMMKRQNVIYIKSFNELGINNHNTSFYKGAYENSKMRFKQAYKILKDNA